MCYVFFFSGTEMTFTVKEKILCALEYARTQSNKTVHPASVREIAKNVSTAIQIWTWHKNVKLQGCLCRARGFGQPPVLEENKFGDQRFLQ